MFILKVVVAVSIALVDVASVSNYKNATTKREKYSYLIADGLISTAAVLMFV